MSFNDCILAKLSNFTFICPSFKPYKLASGFTSIKSMLKLAFLHILIISVLLKLSKFSIIMDKF